MAPYAVKIERSLPLRLARHADAPDDVSFDSWCEREKASGRPLAVDLFSGAGGLGYGVESAGWTVVVAVDHDERALETHRANFRGKALNVDMADAGQVLGLIDRLRPLGIDLVAGGPPCQPFSRAGMSKIRSLVNEGVREETDARRDLWRAFVEVVLAVRPRAVVMENVPDMAIGDDLVVVRSIADALEAAGYAVDYRLLDAWRFGVPQHPKRFFLQARNDGVRPRWPEVAEERALVRDAIADLPRLRGTTGARELPYTGEPKSALARMLRGSSPPQLIYDHVTRPVREDDREAFQLMTPSTLYADLPAHLKRYRSDIFDDKFKRLDWDDLSRTITAHIAKDGYWYIHPEEQRTLTVREAARIQTFPDCFRFSGTRSDAFRQIGNAVPPRLGRVVAEVLVPCTSPPKEQCTLPRVRALLTQWAIDRRETSWWSFPGPDMTPWAAAIISMLDLHRLAPERASVIATPFRGVHDISLASLRQVDVESLSKTRRHAIRRLRQALKADTSLGWMQVVEELLGTAQRATFSILQGGNNLYVNERVAKVVALLMDLPSEQQGLRTDIKVAVAQLVATGPDASLRMSALRTISVSEARSLFLVNARPPSGYDPTALPHEQP